MRGPVLDWELIIGMVTLVASPIGVLAWSLVEPSGAVWAELWRTRLPSMIVSTAVLVTLVVAGTVVVGASLAWLVAAHDFPGRRLIGWLLVAPLAIPGYVGGFVWLETLSDVVGARGVRSLWLCAVVLVLSLYPYVYLFARAAFADQGADTVAAARSLGLGWLGVFLRVALPTARPAIAAGASLVAMEVLTDIGTVRLFNVSTLADGVMRTWFGTGDAGAAAELATVLTGAALMLIAGDRLLRRGPRCARGASEATMGRRRLSSREWAVALSVSGGVLVVALGIPLARLGLWSVDAMRAGRAVTVAGGVRHHVGSTVALAGGATLACVVAGTVLALAVAHRGRAARLLGRLSTVGYAMPGPVVAVGAVVALAALDRRGVLPDGYLLVGSAAGVIYALVVRFFAVAYQGVEASLERVAPAMIDSATVLGAGRLRTALTVELPTARYGVLAAAALLSVDMVKELPITLLLRPFGVDTLSTWVWQATSESLWEQAAVPSLVMVVTGMVAVGALLVAIERGAEIHS